MKPNRFIPPAVISAFSLTGVLVTAQPSHALDLCPGSLAPITSDVVFGGGFSCQIEDKVFSDFEFISADVGFVNNAWSWGVLSGPPFSDYSMTTTNADGLRDFKFRYKISITSDPFFFDKYVTSATGSPTATRTFVKTLEPVLPVAAGPLVATPVGGGTSPVDFFTPNTLKEIVFESELKFTDGFTGGRAQFVSDTVVQRNHDFGKPVPGPLPILGAGVAFAYSRKVRGRIASTKTI